MTSAPALVFATPASMAEHGAMLRRTIATVRRVFARATAAREGRRGRLTHEQMSRIRLVERALGEVRRGAAAEAALGGPPLR